MILPCIRPLICPVCHTSLQQQENTVCCTQGHSFDIAREGYINLLLSRKKLAATIGDSTEMLQARRRFLDSGAYTPLSTAVSQLAQTCLAHAAERIAILDVGCGEGYYVNQIRRAFEKAQPETAVCTFGSDIAKTAVRLAAKRYPTTQFLVADTNRFIPCADQSLQLLLNIFAPRHPAEFARILIPGGCLLIVIPGTAHLQELRTQFSLLDIEPEKQPRLLTQLADNFTQKHDVHVEFPLHLDGQQVHDLVYMMPSARHLSIPQQQALQAVPSYTTTAQFHLLLFQKHDL